MNKSSKQKHWELRNAWLIGLNEVAPAPSPQIHTVVNLFPALVLYVLALVMGAVYGTKYAEYNACRLLLNEDTYILRYFRTATIFDLAHPLRK